MEACTSINVVIMCKLVVVFGERQISHAFLKKKKKIKQSLLAALISNTELDEKTYRSLSWSPEPTAAGVSQTLSLFLFFFKVQCILISCLPVICCRGGRNIVS